MKTALVTGACGFIGYYVSKSLVKNNYKVIGVDNRNDYYDVNLKVARQTKLQALKNIDIHNNDIQEPKFLSKLFETHLPELVIHLAAQAGVRYSIENPRTYLESNIVGTFEILEAARNFPPKHLLIASSSSAYGASNEMPYKEILNSDHQLSFYAATKKSTENMAHSYSSLFNIPTTIFRFFTVYGPWGRPDMALFKFTKSIIEGKPIKVFNAGKMKRDFTYIDDLVDALIMLIDKKPDNIKDKHKYKDDSLSEVAPFRIVNIGNSKPENLDDFIIEIENSLNKKAKKIMLPLQPGDVLSTWADTSLLSELTGFTPKTSIKSGIKNFIDWYKRYHEKY